MNSAISGDVDQTLVSPLIGDRKVASLLPQVTESLTQPSRLSLLSAEIRWVCSKTSNFFSICLLSHRLFHGFAMPSGSHRVDMRER